MRKLTAKQKKLLNTWYSEYQPTSVDELKMEHWELLEKINDTEILWQNVNRYLGDKHIEVVYGKNV